MEILNLAKKDINEVILDLKTDLESGLSQEEAQKRLKRDGLNILPDHSLKWWKIFLRQFKSAFVYLLLFAAVLSFVLKQPLEGSMILIFIVINTLLGFFQEFRSENTVKLLKKFIKIQSKVIRDGQKMAIDSENLVVGDIVELDTGDKIGADMRIIKAQDLLIDESILTGESIEIKKQAEKIINHEDLNHFSANNICFSGTSVVSGKAQAVVLATGKNTFIGGISKITSQTTKVSNFEKGVSQFSSFILKLVLVTLIFIFIFNAFFKDGLDILELTIFSIALVISVIPEVLPLVMTFSFSSGARNLAKHQVVVKRLSSVEDLGNIDILCSDKTGTLTENKLTIIDFYNSICSSERVLRYAALAVSQLREKVEPFDIAIMDKLDDSDREAIKKYEYIIDTPFNPARQRNNVLVRSDEGLELIVRGAVETLFNLSSNLSSEKMEDMRRWISEQGFLGRRVLAIAKKKISDTDIEVLKKNLIEAESDLEFLGLFSLADPIKESVKKAVVDANELKVGIKIITGDSSEIAGSVAYQIGLIDDPKKVILASDLLKLSEEDKRKALDEYQVFARVLPEQKFEIIKILQEKYNVGYLGDGINDAPALKVAGVSLVVANASDIAREAADIVLLKNDLNVIVEGIKEGRTIFANSSKYIKATLASNFGNFYAVAIASLIIDFLPMLPLQILLLNLLSDFPMIAIATDRVDKEELLSPKKYQVKNIIIVATIFGILKSVFEFIFFAMFYRMSPEILQTNWFIASVLIELIFLFSIRTKKPVFKAQRPSKLVVGLTLGAVLLTILTPLTTWGQKIFQFIKPSWSHLGIIIILTIVYFIFSEVVKFFYYRNKKGDYVVS
ncbi:MAG: cation-translocating P-type ATPase [Patescibacteria group bacterium]|jgi:Mg2+-importing ATPase